MMRIPTVNRHVTAVMENEWAQLRRNKVVIFTTLGPPLLLIALSLMVLFLTTFLEVDLTQVERAPALPLGASESLGLNRTDTMRSALLTPFLVMFQMIPLVVPVTIASYSIVGEKQSRSLEALLATPVRTWELLLGKAFAAAVPGVLATWYTYLIFAISARFMVSDDIFTKIIVSQTWILAVVLLTPLFALLAVELAIMISSRVSDAQSAQQLGSLLVLPLIGVLVAQVTGAISLGVGSVVGSVIFAGALDALLLFVSVRLFSRETILMRWR
jgi:ABC-2 type transport system permease protein